MRAWLAWNLPQAVLATGGDTFLGCARAVDACEILPLQEPFDGVPLSIMKASGREVPVLSKSGGFGATTLLTDLRTLITSGKL